MNALEVLEAVVEPGWIDYNGHMNVAYYHLAFDRATDRFLEGLGLGRDYVEKGRGSLFALEDHLTYQRELREGEPFRISLQWLAHDRKRLHYFLRMSHRDQGFLSATCEHLSIYVDFGIRRSAPMPDWLLEKLNALGERHRSLPRPPEAGRPMRVRSRS